MLWAVMLAVVLAAAPAGAHGDDVDIVVEALIETDGDGAVIDYGISLRYADGDPVSGAEVVVAGEGGLSASAAETVPGVYIIKVALPSREDRRMTIGFDHPDASGSVDFMQAFDDVPESGPVVMVDTAEPERIGTFATDSGLLGGEGPPPRLDAGVGRVIVEAFIADATDPLLIEYAVALGDVPEPTDGVMFSAIDDRGMTIGPIVLTVQDGAHRTTIRYPTAAVWTVTLDTDAGSGAAQVVFTENVPWPHYTTDAGRPKVKVDTARPERNGAFAEPTESIYLAGRSETGVADRDREPDPTPARPEVVAQVSTTPASAVTRDVGLRLFHLAAIALWVVPVVAAAFGRTGPPWVAAAMAGVGFTVVSGIALALWGAPLSYPGLLRWSELGQRFYGSAYQNAVLVKMGAVAVAAAATFVWARRRTRRPLSTTLAAVAVAVVAVTAMSQFHLFSH